MFFTSMIQTMFVTFFNWPDVAVRLRFMLLAPNQQNASVCGKKYCFGINKKIAKNICLQMNKKNVFTDHLLSLVQFKSNGWTLSMTYLLSACHIQLLWPQMVCGLFSHIKVSKTEKSFKDTSSVKKMLYFHNYSEYITDFRQSVCIELILWFANFP